MPLSLGGHALRLPITTAPSFGKGVCPYGPTNGYAAGTVIPTAASGAAFGPNMVTGFSGPPAWALRQPKNWYIRTGGSNNNGGDSAGTSADRGGTDGVTNSTTLFTSASAAFTSADVGRAICINIGSSAQRFLIAAVASATNITLSRANTTSVASLTWAIGGAWADLRAAIGDAAVTAGGSSTSSPVQSGDNVYVGGGTYRAVYAIPGAGGTLWAPAFNGQVNIIADVDGAKTTDSGMVQFTAYTTNDKTAPSATTLLNLSGKSNLLFQGIMFVGGAATVLTATTLTSQNVTFQDCSILAYQIGAQRLASISTAFNTRLNWLFDRCRFMDSNANLLLLLTSGTGSDYDAGLTFRNCISVGQGSTAFISVTGGANPNKGGGVRFVNFTSNHSLITTTAAQVSTIFPCSVLSSVILAQAGTALSAGTSGHITENYNVIHATTPRTNVTAGAQSFSDGSYPWLAHFGQETVWGGQLRPFGEPMSGSPLLGFGNQDPVAANPVDLRNNPRPAGLGAAGSQLPAVGAYERANTTVQATSPAPPSGTNVWKFVGPGYQDFTLPVDTSSTTVACTVQRDANYTGSVLPSLAIIADPGTTSIGVAAQTVYDTAAASQNNTITLAPFTATAIGAVRVRVRSQDLTGTSVVAFSVFTIT